MDDELIAAAGDAAPRDIVTRIGAGDFAAEAELVKRYSRPLMALLNRRTSDIQRAEDAHQDAFRIIIERLRNDGIERPSKIAAYLHQTAINLLNGDFRKEARRKTYPDTELIERQSDNQLGQLRQLIRDESGSAVRDVIQGLTTQRDRELLYRFYIAQQEKCVICQALELTSVHFDRVIARARKRFRQLIEQKKPELILTRHLQ